jgi:predicted negative regulator of RcsB-dependent stress response
MKMSEATQTPTLEQTLNKTDLGHTIFENRKIFFGALIAVLIGATAYVGWKQTQKSSALNQSVKVFEFQSGPWAEAKAGKTGVPELVKAFEGLDENVRTAPVMLPVVLEMGKFLYEKGNYAEAETILSKIADANKHPIATFFVGMQRVAVLEKLGKIDEAIKVLEPMAQNKEVLMPAKVSIELGRLYLAKGEKAKAQSQFDYVISTFPNDEQAKLAKLYLSQLSK